MRLDRDADYPTDNENDDDDAHPSLQTRRTAQEASNLICRFALPHRVQLGFSTLARSL